MIPAYYSDIFQLPLPDEHRFPIAKYRLLRERLEGLGSTQLDLRPAPAATEQQLARVHTREYIDKVRLGQLTALEEKRIGFPWSEAMVQRCFHSAGGTVAACQAAQSGGLGIHLAGGTHHAFADAGQGFCVFNDVAVSSTMLMAEGHASRVVIIDCDVHQGNGTADIFKQCDDVFCCSLHGERNYPFRKCDGDLDLAFPDETDDEPYLEALDYALKQIPLDEADAAFYLAGADPFVGDRLGRLAITKAGLIARDRRVIESCHQRKIPLTIVMAGGYAQDINDIVDIHTNTVITAAEIYGA